MPNTNGSQSLTKSMNGLIELEDGGGTIIEGGIVTCNEVITNNIQGQSVNDAITLYTDTTTGLVTLKNIILGTNTITSTTPLLPFNLFTNQVDSANVVLGGNNTRIWVSSFRFRDNLMTVSALNTTVNLLTNQTGPINLGTVSLTINIGSFRVTNDALNLITPSNTASLFTTQTGGITIGNVGTLTLKGTTVNINATTTNIDGTITNIKGTIANITAVNTNITSTTTITSPITTINATGKVDVKTPIFNVLNNGGYFELTAESNLIWMDFHSNSSFQTDYDTRISSSGGTASTGGGTLDLIAATTNITSPTTTINATTSATITSPLTNIVATTKVNITTPSLNVINGTSQLELRVVPQYAIINFNSSINVIPADYDTRIYSYQGTATNGQGTLFLESKSLNITSPTVVDINTITLNVKNGGNYIEMATGNNLALIDFHSNSSFSTDWDARIISQGGSASSGGGALYLNAYATGGSINLDTPTIRINNNLFRYVPPTTYVPVISNGTCPYRRGSYSITGSMMTVHITFNTIGGGGTTGSGIYGFGIPTGFTIRTVAYNAVPTNGEVQLYDLATGTSGDMSGTSVGNGYIQLRGVNMATTCIVPFTNNLLAAYGSSQTQGNTNWHGSTYYQFGAPNIVMSFSATFPIN